MPAKRKPKKEIEKRFEDFGEEMEGFGKKFECPAQRPFGIIWPIVSSIFGIILLAIAIWLLGFISRESGIGFLAAISNFLLNYIGLFFILSIFFSYADYFRRIAKKEFAPFSPIAGAAGVTFAFWILAHLLLIANSYISIAILQKIALFALAQKYLIFVFFLFVLYLAFLLGRKEEEKIIREEKHLNKKSEKQSGIKRLYRSGKEKLLGGVCGGIAEYFNIDPVIVRLLWIALCFAGGAGIILYIIAWIIIPRNPEHKWN
ncbi:MAG: PspC domain-containing protein [Candidatus ainarchaeum sp.]|nr:PspC domain-containing protein [Candidatus ainarchaeum sp.]